MIDFLANNGVLSSQSATEIDVKDLYDFDEQLAKEADELEYVDIDYERIESLHVLADGWAGKLQCFMNEIELLEVLHYKTITARDGQRYLQSVPIT